MTHIAFCEVTKEQKAYLKKALPRQKLSFVKELTPAAAKKVSAAEVLAVFVHAKVTNDILDQLPKVKLVTTMSTGYDHIDLETCKQRKIIVSNVPTYGENTVAEHAFALLLAVTRKMYRAIGRVKQGKFSTDHLQGSDLKGKTIGIVGMGNIGKHLARMASGFEMNIIAFDVRKDATFAKQYKVKYKPLPEVLKNADVLSFHVPLIKQTYHLINKKNLNKLKKGVILINTSRGAVIETAALLQGLRKGIISAAGLDVLEDEEHMDEESLIDEKEKVKHHKRTQLLVQQHQLAKQENVLITPHNAFNSKEAVQRILDTTVENIRSWKRGRSKNKV